MTAEFRVEALEEAISRYGAPEIFNTDQGSQFTAASFINFPRSIQIRVSMDKRGAWRDNVFVQIRFFGRAIWSRTIGLPLRFGSARDQVAGYRYGVRDNRTAEAHPGLSLSIDEVIDALVWMRRHSTIAGSRYSAD
jgi:hypothetical protein